MNSVEKYEQLAHENKLSQIMISPFYMKKVQEEISKIGKEGPLYRCVLPTKERLKLRVNNEVVDFVDDIDNMPIKGVNTVIQKYDDRLLLLLTTECVSKCQYCFRHNILNTYTLEIENNLPQIADYINKNKKIEEVIFSGGDPLTVPIKKLEKILYYLKKNTNVKYFRIHTRAIVYSPKIFDDKLIMLLKKYNVKLYFHIVHPYEICNVVEKKINYLHKKGIKMYNQFPLLRNINDNPELLLHHLKKMSDLNVTTITMFIPDPIVYSASFRMPLSRVFEIVDKINLNSPSWVNNIRVILDTPYGKVRRENIYLWDKRKGIITFKRGNKTIDYYDFPKKYDIQGNINKMLWKGKI